jgi:hypothetical protein
MGYQVAHVLTMSRSLAGCSALTKIPWHLALTSMKKGMYGALPPSSPLLLALLFQCIVSDVSCQSDHAPPDTMQTSNKIIRNTIYAGAGGFGTLYSINYEISWGYGKKVWGVGLGGYYKSESDGSRSPMSSTQTWQVQLNRMPLTRSGFEYGAGFIYSSGIEATESDTGYPQRLFLGLKPACIRIQFRPKGIMVRIYALGLITLHEFNSEWKYKLVKLNDKRFFGNAMFFPLSARLGFEIGYTF